MSNLIKKINRFNKPKFFFDIASESKIVENGKFQSLTYLKKSETSFQLTGGMRYKNLFKNPIKDYPLISIIMPNYKEKNLINAIKSVTNQSYPNLELIVIDGNSGERAIKVLHEYNEDIDIWVSENDNGLWDAWNKGFKLARGDFVGIVDSSNELYENSIDILINYVLRNENIDFICGTVKKGNKIFAGYRPKDIKKQLNIIPSSVVGFYIKLSSLKKVGLLNLKYKIQSDYDLIYRMVVIHNLKGIRTKSDEIFGNVGEGGYSLKHGYFKTIFNELKIRFDNKQNIFFLIYIFFGRTLMKIYKSLMFK